MKKFIEKGYAAGAIVLALLFAGGIFLLATYGKTSLASRGLYAEEITMEEVPEAIKSEMEGVMESPGAYFYKETNDSKEVYVLLTAGKVVGVNMISEPVEEDGGMYFSVAFQDNGGVEEELLYKVYKTNASAVAGDALHLKNPYEQVGDTGMNIGLLKKMDSGIGYYITPLMDPNEVNRVYVPADDSLAELEDGIYLYTYQLTSDGVVLTSAEKRTDYEVLCAVTEFADEPQASATLLLNNQIKIKVNVKDGAVLNTLRENDFEKYSLNGWVTLSVDGAAEITSLQVKNYNSLIEEETEANIEKEETMSEEQVGG